jgi:hypothetical protein
MRLEKAQNALRGPPEGNRNGQTASPGFRFMFGLSARKATSVPDASDWRKKFARSAASEANRSRDDRFGGRRRRLAQVAPATAARPTGRSGSAQPEIMSQKARRSAPRVAATRGVPTGPVSSGLNAAIQNRKPDGASPVDGSEREDPAPPLTLAAQIGRRPPYHVSSADAGRATMFVRTRKATAAGAFGGPVSVTIRRCGEKTLVA